MKTPLIQPTDVLDVLKKLPSVCFSYLPTTGQLIAIKRGAMGYYPITLHRTTRLTAEQMNERDGVTMKQLMAMEAGSHFGWDCPGADPDNYTDEEAESWREVIRKRYREAS